MNQYMVGYSKPDRPPLGILQAFGDFSRGGQDERIWARRKRLDQSVGPIVDSRVHADFGQIGADQRKIVLLVRAADPMNSVNRLLVANVTAECIAGIRRVRDKASIADDLHNSLNPARLRVRRVNFDEFRHARIVGERRLRA